MIKKITLGIVVLIFTFSLAACSSWDRMMKSVKSDFNGLQRELIVTNQNGEVIYKDSGKFDIEVNDYRVKYIDEKGKLHIIYLGASTAIVNEK
ncbi:hypothetical protein ACWOEY_11135 [Enterococcus sulfureus]